MPRYRVIGANRETGEDVELVITADSDEDAEAVAIARGILIRRLVGLEAATDATDAIRPVVTEQTSKRIKLHYLLASAGVAVSFVVLVIASLVNASYVEAYADESFGAKTARFITIVSIPMLLASICWWVWARFMKYWHHE